MKIELGEAWFLEGNGRQTHGLKFVVLTLKVTSFLKVHIYQCFMFRCLLRDTMFGECDVWIIDM